MTAPPWYDVGALDAIDPEFGLAVRVGEQAIALFREGDTVFAVEDFCPHQGSPLSGGLTRNGVLTCPLHAWQFKLATGENVDGGPGIRTFPVRISGDRVQIRA